MQTFYQFITKTQIDGFTTAAECKKKPKNVSESSNFFVYQVLYISHNYIKDWREFEHMTELPVLEDHVFIGNPLEEELSAGGKYTEEIIKRLLYLKVKADGGSAAALLSLF